MMTALLSLACVLTGVALGLVMGIGMMAETPCRRCGAQRQRPPHPPYRMCDD